MSITSLAAVVPVFVTVIEYVSFCPTVPEVGEAADRLHWLRSEFDAAETDADRLRVAKQLLDRAEAAGDKAEALRWRAIAGSKADPPQK